MLYGCIAKVHAKARDKVEIHLNPDTYPLLTPNLQPRHSVLDNRHLPLTVHSSLSALPSLHHGSDIAHRDDTG